MPALNANKRRDSGSAPATDDGSAFDRLLSAAFSTLIAFLLACRFLLVHEDSERRKRTLALLPPPSLPPSPPDAPEDESGRAPITRPKVEGSSRGQSPVCREEATSSAARPLGLPSLRTPLPAYPAAFMDDASIDELVDGIMAQAQPSLLDSSSDDDSEGDAAGALPAYLDTITEEDTDDLVSVSSGGLISPPASFRPAARSRIPLPLTLTAPLLKGAAPRRPSPEPAALPDLPTPTMDLGAASTAVEMAASSCDEADAEGSEGSPTPLPPTIHFSRTGRVKTRRLDDAAEEPRRASLGELGGLFNPNVPLNIRTDGAASPRIHISRSPVSPEQSPESSGGGEAESSSSAQTAVEVTRSDSSASPLTILTLEEEASLVSDLLEWEQSAGERPFATFSPAARAATADASPRLPIPPPTPLLGAPPPPPQEMDIDLERVLERFHHYGEVYGDAPPSGVDERPGQRLRDASESGSDLLGAPPTQHRPLGLERSPLPSLGSTLESVREVHRTAHTTVISSSTHIRREGLSPRAREAYQEGFLTGSHRKERPVASPPQPPTTAALDFSRRTERTLEETAKSTFASSHFSSSPKAHLHTATVQPFSAQPTLHGSASGHTQPKGTLIVTDVSVSPTPPARLSQPSPSPTPATTTAMTKGSGAYMNWAAPTKTHSTPEPPPRVSLSTSKQDLDTITGREVSGWFHKAAPDLRPTTTTTTTKTYVETKAPSPKKVDSQPKISPKAVPEATEWRLRTTAAFVPEPTRILPPTTWVEDRVRTLSPAFPTKVHHKEELPKLEFAHHLSSEHLQHLLEDPYYKDEPPLSSSRGGLTTDVVRSWERRPEGSPLSSQQNLERWRQSTNTNLTDQVKAHVKSAPKAPERAKSPYGGSAMSFATSEGAGSVSELRRANMTAEEMERESNRASRRSKYKHKIAKAKADFIANAGSVSDLYKTRDEFEHKFKVSMEDVMRPLEPARGPVASTHGPLTTRSNVNLNLPPMRYARMPTSAPCDAEYERLVRDAEQRWGAAYKHRTQPTSLYGRSRAVSTGYLETNVDTGEDAQVVQTGIRRVEETDMDAVHKSGTSVDRNVYEHQSRSRAKETEINAPGPRNDNHFRAKSVDYLMDRHGREAVEPPENELQKVLGDSRSRVPSEAEVRFKASTERLLAEVPGWYRDPEPQHHACHAIAGKGSGTIYGQERPIPTPTPAWRPSTAQSNYTHMRPITPTTLHPLPTTSTTGTASQVVNRSTVNAYQSATDQKSYVSPWPTGGRFSGGKGPIPVGGQFARRESPSTSRRTREEEAAKRKREAMLLPDGMFDRYAQEIEELRLSRTSLNHLNEAGRPPIAAVLPRQAADALREESLRTPESELQRWETSRSQQDAVFTSTPKASPPQPAARQLRVQPPDLQRYETPPQRPQDFSSRLTSEQREFSSTSKSVQIQETVMIEGRQTPQMHGGWSVSRVPSEWNQPGARNSRVIEVTDTFADKQRRDGVRLAGHLTLEEILDGMLALDPTHRRLGTLDESSGSLGDSVSNIPNVLPHTPDSSIGPFIFTRNYLIMDRVIKSPHHAEQLLRNEQLYVQCGCCGRTKELEEARTKFLGCKYCYTYYCTRRCRLTDWPSHKEQCNFSRINTICKEVILKVKEDPMSQWEMSQVAREGNAARGRGAVNFRFKSPFVAADYVDLGWDGLVQKTPDTFLYFYTVPNLVEGKKDPNLIALCRRYDPRAKFILSVSIIADVEDCPETPPMAPRGIPQWPPYSSVSGAPTPRPSAAPTPVSEIAGGAYWNENRGQYVEEDSISIPSFATGPDFVRTQSLPHRNRRQTAESEASAVLRSVLRSMENIAPGIPPQLSGRVTPDPTMEGFRRETGRHTISAASSKHFHHPAYLPPRRTADV